MNENGEVKADKRRANVLLVDDKAENLLALESVLAELGQNLVQASSAREALRHLLLEDFALILLDVQMPGLSGFELAELIRERERTQHTPIIFISAESINEQFIFKGYSLGAVDYLTKPVEPEILKSKVRFFSKVFLQQDQIRRQAVDLSEANTRLDELNAVLEERVRLRTLELEKTNRELEAEVAERRRSEARLATEHAITRALALASDLEPAITSILSVFIENMDASVANRWEVAKDGHSIVCRETLSSPDKAKQMKGFIAESKALNFKFGKGLPGEVWARKAPVWLASTVKGENFPRSRQAAAAGLFSGIGFPIKISGEVCGVIEFFATEMAEPDAKLLEMLEVVGSEIGQFIQRKQIEEERENLLLREKVLREDAENANRMKDEFLATLSHELRTPLNSILGWSQIVLNDMVEGEGLRAALETIHRNATAQAQLIEELLEASRLITGKILLNLEPTDIVPVIEAAIEIVRPRAAAKSIEIKSSFESGSRTITSDQTRLQQMVWNLLTNAIKFTPNGGRVEVGTDLLGDNIRIMVTDSGMGIAPDFLPFVFDRFRQQDSTSTRRHDGLGLGLAIVRHLAELHGGQVAAESGGLETGSTFIISLPILQSERSIEAAPADETDRSDGNGKLPVEESLKDILIHVVDDDVDSCNLLTFAFGLRGARVNTSNSAADAFRAISEEPPDILLADINMPDEDGYSLIRRIRELNSTNGNDFPSIALTAMARAEDSDRALSAGFRMHVPKPIEIDELTITIQELLKNKNNSNKKAAV
jgi:signal transduction histidine kinase/DNA-binding response OmpR family regulator